MLRAFRKSSRGFAESDTGAHNSGLSGLCKVLCDRGAWAS